ncbi:CBS and ACT domain-containing protein [Dehalobacterium formicoaceticum]|uniref:CBS and ACT domain-containing protein n=1 Tax=Dehalobacterium formicoaceticum TaxID=51515 RepID=A0ABT1Y595_9FIRM|nr:CBS and ACT domain-containing protein [Dehalobacterium formicoaceticum]MCR6546044.1 CBS and ACT domain-containing protein [Dehalobacterium formicoaceticum]
MIVKEIMKTDLKTVLPSATIYDAVRIMKTHNLRHLPVVNESFHLLGIISDRDLRDEGVDVFQMEDNNELQNAVSKVMSTNLITGTPLDFIEEAAALLYEFKIGCLPIVLNKKLVGIITGTDILNTFVQITGSHKPSSRIEIRIPNIPGILCPITYVFQRRRLNIISILLYPAEDEKHDRLVIRVQAMNTDAIVKELKEEGFDVIWPETL